MENENFEKKTWEDFKLEIDLSAKTDDEILALGYNTCLDRTNAKGIYEALIEADELLARLEDFTHGQDGMDITKLRGKIQTELKKAEDN